MTSIPLVIEPLPGIGDLMWFLPHLRAIASTVVSKKIYLLTKQSSMAHELLQAEDIIADYIWLKRERRQPNQVSLNDHNGIMGWWYLAQKLKHYHFQTVWILHHSRYYAQTCKVAGINKRIGYTSSRWINYLTHPLLINSNHNLTAREKATALLNHYGYDLNAFAAPLMVCDSAEKKIQQLLCPHACSSKFIVGVGASEPKKCWPIEKFIQLIQWLLKHNHCVIICGSQAEQAKALQIIAECNNHKNLINCTKQSLQETVALIKDADYYIGNDTSLMNIAVNQYKQAFVLFGPTYTVYSNYIIPITNRSMDITSTEVADVQHYLKKYIFQNG